MCFVSVRTTRVIAGIIIWTLRPVPFFQLNSRGQRKYSKRLASLIIRNWCWKKRLDIFLKHARFFDHAVCCVLTSPDVIIVWFGYLYDTFQVVKTISIRCPNKTFVDLRMSKQFAKCAELIGTTCWRSGG